MPYKEKEIEKLYYSVGDVASMLGENTSLIRFWAGKFSKYIHPVRNKKGNRMFTARDVNNFRLIYNLVKEKKMTLDGALKRLDDNFEGTDKRFEVISLLQGIRSDLQEVSSSLNKRIDENKS